MTPQIECTICGIVLEGVFLTLNIKSTFSSFSQDDLESFNITNLAFECGHEGCSTTVCHQCTAKLKREKYRRVLIKREYPVCPVCGGHFGVGGARLLVAGRFPLEISTIIGEYWPNVGKMVFNYVREVKFGYARGDDDIFSTTRAMIGKVFLPSVCSLCMNEPADNIQRMEIEERGRVRFTTKYEYPICKACHALLAHKAIEHPGHPYFPISIFDASGQQAALRSMKFVNSTYGDMVDEYQDKVSDNPWNF
jgi:hypothetical protein